MTEDNRASGRHSRRQILGGGALVGAATVASGMVTGAGSGAAAAASTPLRTESFGPGPVDITLRVNGREHRLSVEPRVTLLDALRERLGLTGTKKGCNQGACGACTVLADGRRINSCLTLAVMQRGVDITTVEGLAQDGPPHPMQRSFLEHDAFQCGFCTPGQIVSAVAVVDEGHAGSPAEIREWMSGNICRCGAYPNIVAAVRDAAERAER